MSRKCEYCGAESFNYAHYCGHCGKRFAKVHDWKVYDASKTTLAMRGLEQPAAKENDTRQNAELVALRQRYDSLNKELKKAVKDHDFLIWTYKKEISEFERNPLARLWSEFDKFADDYPGWPVLTLCVTIVSICTILVAAFGN